MSVLAEGVSTCIYADNLWPIASDGRDERQLTDLAGRRASMANECIATDGAYLYFAWQEDLGDIWVIDILYDEP